MNHAQTIADPGSVPWLCAALFLGGLLLLVIGRGGGSR